MDEFSSIAKILYRQTVDRSDVVVPAGDDGAVLKCPQQQEIVSSMDVLVSGEHFPVDTNPMDIGHKSLAVNLSDMAAMGATPAWVMMAITLPKPDSNWLGTFCEGFFELAEQFGVQLIGGDLSRGPLSVCIQITGFVETGTALRRDGAQEGDLVFVSGSLGDAALGLRCLRGEINPSTENQYYLTNRFNRPQPRIELGIALRTVATAAIDISDGLVADLGHICRRSGRGARLDIEQVPVSGAYRSLLSQVGYEPAISFGDDYELCFTVNPNRVSEVDAVSKQISIPLAPVGTITNSGLTLLCQGKPYSVRSKGHQHFA